MSDVSVDVVVVGAGLAGMCAAVEAANGGARALVVERAPFVGGSAAISAGFVWSLEDLNQLAEEDGGEHSRYGHLVVTGLDDALEWLRPRTVALGERRRGNIGPGQHFDMEFLFSQLTTELSEKHGQVWTSSEVTDIRRTEDGWVLSVQREDASVRVRATHVILATGGRQADPAVRSRLIGAGHVPPLRGNPYSNGGGARIAESVGGTLNLDNDGFYGHLFPAGVRPHSPTDFLVLAQYHSAQGLLLAHADSHLIGLEVPHDHLKALELAKHGGRGLLIWTDEVQKAAVAAQAVPGSPVLNRWDVARRRGARVGFASDLASLAAQVGEWGYDIDALPSVAATAFGDSSLYAMDVEVAITFTFGGVVVDEDGVVVDSTGDPIPGLFAVGADMSDAYHRGYGGGLALAIVTGRRAGVAVAEAIRSAVLAAH